MTVRQNLPVGHAMGLQHSRPRATGHVHSINKHVNSTQFNST